MNLLIIRQDKILFGLYIFIILSEWIGNFISQPLGIRHLSLLLVPLLFIRSLRAQKRTLMYLCYLTILSILAYLFDNADFFNFSVGYFFTFFFLFIHVIFYSIGISYHRLINLLHLIVFANLVFAMPTLFGALVDFDLRNHPGVFREVGAFATTMMASQIICLLLYRLTSRSKYFKLACFFSLICMLTILKKTMFLSLFVWVLYAAFYLDYKKWLFNPRVWISLVLITLVIATPTQKNFAKNLSYLNHVGAENHVRIGMYISAVKISIDHAPFGSGLGTFGSFASIINNSISEGYFDYKYNDIYHRYGVASIAGNSEERMRDGGMTVLDTYWPHILAELGIVGFIVMLSFWARQVYTFFINRKRMNIQTSAFAFYICAIYIAVIGEGLALIQPELPFFVFFHAGLSAMFLRKISTYKRRRLDKF